LRLGIRIPSVLAMLAALAAVVVASAILAGPASAAMFSGGCKLSGPITPLPPITLVPRPNPHFDYAGSGVCGGRPATLTFVRASTLFDTCELGPDFPLHGVLAIGASRFAVSIDLVRVALAGPFVVTTRGGGLGVGVASFNPGNQTAAIEHCLGAGVGSASLSASFSTLRPLVGT
jgi:hypothetical protein